ncbi:MAG: hypothetical protein AAGI22_12710 [Planctomycetota bacterium]
MIGNEERLIRPMFGRRWRVLHADAEVVHASADLDLYRSTDAGATFHFVARAGETWRDRALARTPLVSRLLRCGFHGLTPLPNGDMVAVVRGAILHRAAGADRFEVAHRIERGSRPLNVGLAPSGRLFFGEYFGNPDRAEVHVYGSDDGRSWEVAHTFPAGSIRHVHGVHADPYRGGVWVLTGDDDQESGLYWSDDDLATLEPVVSGTQRARAVAVLPRPDAVIVPTDTPRETNWIQRLDPSTGTLERVRPVPGSVFHATRTRRLSVVSTTVEPSDVNTDERAALLVSSNDEDWTVIARFGPDLPLPGSKRGLLQYPTLRLPAGTGASRILATGQAVAGAHGRLLAWEQDVVLRAITRDVAEAPIATAA